MTTRLTLSRVSSVPATRAGEEIRALRQRLGWTQDEFAGLLATHRDTLSAWERGVYEPPLAMLRLARYTCLCLPPRSTFIPATTDSAIPFVEVRPGSRCYWQHAAEPCGGWYYSVQARLSRRRNVVSEVCEKHLSTAFDAVVTKLEEAAKAEQRRQNGRRRKRLARHRVREGTTAAAAADPTT
jgi:transcriptional regulator with XRE-family HTH domain